MNTVPTYTATIYVGSKRRYDGEIVPLDTARAVCHAYCDEVGLCVTFIPLEFIYTAGKSEGGEPGFAVGLINYPRFPDEPGTIREQALELAGRLMRAMCQMRVSVVMPDETVMLSNPDLAAEAA